MTRMTTTNQKKNTTIAGIAYPPTVLALATPPQLPGAARIIRSGHLSPAIHRQLVGPALAAAVETGTLEAQAYQHWLAAAQDAEMAGTTATRSPGWSSQPASPSRAARRSPANTGIRPPG